MKPSLSGRFLPLAVAVALTATVAARATLFSAFSIPSASMRPTLEIGDHVLVTSYAETSRGKGPARGEVIVFRSPLHQDQFYTKRIIGVPGDVVEIRKGRVRINGVTLAEPYVREWDATSERGAEIIPMERYFVLGDYRSDSSDSRVWGPVPSSLIVGRARVIFWSAEDSTHPPLASASTASGPASPGGTSIRWNRFLMPIR